ncbi:MAG: hypothetical protein ABIG20_04695 [archaeon]
MKLHRVKRRKKTIPDIKEEIEELKSGIVHLNDQYMQRTIEDREYERKKQDALHKIHHLEERILEKKMENMGENM